MADKKIQDVEGIGEVNGKKLADAGCGSTDKLLEAGCTKEGRAALAEKTGISEKQILKWVNMADLFRVKGVAGEYAELLECSGVDTVPELAQRKPENLHAKMTEVNEAKKLTRKLPTLKGVTDWVAQAKELGRKVQY